MRLLDLFCGQGGWSVAAIRRGWKAFGIDAFEQPLYPGNFSRCTLPIAAGRLFADYRPDAVCCSPPCDEYARHHLPWCKGPAPNEELMAWSLSLIQALPCPVIVECSRFAAWHFPGSSRCGSLQLWGAVPTLLPTISPHKMAIDGRYPGRRAVIPRELADRFFEEVEARHSEFERRTSAMEAT